MASNKRKQDEKHLKTLREMVALPINKQCFDCHQRGPTYVNMTIGSFVCTSCSGILRGLNPPHRVKSISMASFTPEEMEVLKSHGNELNRKVYLGLYDSRSWPEPDSRDEQRVRDYMVQKYENKRWYVAPTEAMKEDAKRANEAALVSKPQAKPLRSMLGENASRLVNQAPASSQTGSALQPPPVKAVVSSPALSLPQAPAANSVPAPVQATAAKKSDGFDLLGELGGDPFASNAPAAPVTNNAVGGFADFSNFGSFNSTTSIPSQPAPSLPPQSAIPSNPAFPISNTPLLPMGSNAPAAIPATAAQNKTQAAPSPAAGLSMGDRYAALADLDSAFSAPTTTAPSINWGGNDVGMSGGGGLNWGGNSTAPANPTSQSQASLGWGSNGGGGAAINWNNPPASTGTSMGPTPVSTGFGAPSTGAFGNPFLIPNAANPFGASQAPPPYSTPAVSNPNPFGAPQTATTGFGAAPAAAASPFQSQAGFGQFPPMQNGGFGMTPASTAAFGTTGAAQGIGVFPGHQQPQQSPFMMQQQQHQHQQQVPSAGMGGWGAMGGAPMGGQQQPSANPFMSAAMQQQHVPPPSGATNPFL